MAMAVDPLDALDPPLSAAEYRFLKRASGRLPLAWTASPRRRRLLVVGLAAPGFLLIVSTPFHQMFALLIAGIVLFLGALAFRPFTERVFVRAEAAALWPPSNPSPDSPKKDRRHA